MAGGCQCRGEREPAMADSADTILDPLDVIPAEPEQEGDICVVRLTTSWWHDKRGAHMRKDLTYLIRRSSVRASTFLFTTNAKSDSVPK